MDYVDLVSESDTCMSQSSPKVRIWHYYLHHLLNVPTAQNLGGGNGNDSMQKVETNSPMFSRSFSTVSKESRQDNNTVSAPSHLAQSSEEKLEDEDALMFDASNYVSHLVKDPYTAELNPLESERSQSPAVWPRLMCRYALFRLAC